MKTLFMISLAILALALVGCAIDIPLTPNVPAIEPDPPFTPTPTPGPGPGPRMQLDIYTATGCPPCEGLKQSMGVSPMSDALQNYDVKFWDRDAHMEMFKTNDIQGTPTSIILDRVNHVEKDRLVGFRGPDEYAAWLSGSVSGAHATGPYTPLAFRYDYNLPWDQQSRRHGDHIDPVLGTPWPGVRPDLGKDHFGDSIEIIQ